ncbi:uncharacterized protein L201_000184 [Kwoniella dendrophila CBS 6074]|uniref:Uncharacterized protein n=1 Tax=Kwoniella dendrophila CBS 6074 TaxID=1295534 RepID=A0AAX4JIM3_9TREE
MGNSNSKKLALNAIQFRVYSFQSHDAFTKCGGFLTTLKDAQLADKVSVVDLTQDLTFVACYRIIPYKMEEVRNIRKEMKQLLGSGYTVDFCH